MSDPAPHPATLPAEMLLADCDVERLRRSGPGGQHRNKVETAIRLTHRPTGITAMATERRSQAANLAQALRRLRINLALGFRASAQRAPSLTWTSRCRGGRVHISSKHEDFPALLAEALDALQAAEWNLSAAAGTLGCTQSQLLKLLKREPRALSDVNRHRTAEGRKPYL